MNKLRSYLQNNPKLYRTIIYMNVIFIACFSFPLRSSPFPLVLWKVYSLVVCYGVVSLGFISIFGDNRSKSVYIMCLVLSGIGLFCRYLLEYGEVSNIRNFTLFNIISFLVIIPIYTTCIYRLFVKSIVKQE